MAALTDTGFPNLAHWAKRQNPDGGIADIVNVLSTERPEINDIPWVEGNLPTGHRITSAQALPSPSWRQLNAGVAITKGETQQFDETCGMLEDESAVDVDLAALNGNAAAYRASEDSLKKEAFGQEFCQSMWYESVATNPERIHGLTPRYPATTGYTASSYTLVDANEANSGTNCHSIWLVSWSPQHIFGIFPKGSMMGFQVEDMGKQRVLDGNSLPYYAWVTRFQWKCGIAVRDYRYAVRYQWDPDSAVHADGERSLPLAMDKMLSVIYKLGPSTRFYMNRTSKQKLDAQLASNESRLLTYTSDGGGLVASYKGVVVRVTDSLVAETAIT